MPRTHLIKCLQIKYSDFSIFVRDWFPGYLLFLLIPKSMVFKSLVRKWYTIFAYNLVYILSHTLNHL
jgi:hypothetical protein